MAGVVFLCHVAALALVGPGRAAVAVRVAPRARVAVLGVPRAAVSMMGRRFENNKMRMAKSQAQYAKKASYIGKKVIIAVKASGPDPDINRALAGVIREANALEVLKDVIDRNIKRALEPDTSDFKELTFEAYGFGGVGLVINVLSDNNNRAAAEINTAVSKAGCKIANPGSVSYNFARGGRLCLNKAIGEDALLELAIEAGCEGDVSVEPPDYEGRGDAEAVKCVVLTSPTELGTLQAALQAAGYACSGQLVHVPSALLDVSEEDEASNFKCIDRLEELDDVSFVEHNMRVSAAVAD
jgi:YebC/PmpR family DNA-binding regulatory protein